MNILDKIKIHKKKETEERKSLYPLKLLEKSIYFEAPVVSLKQYLLRSDKVGIIAEIKRKSPSRGFINKYVNIERTSIGYMQAGANALSVLTDSEFFAGSNEDLTVARKFNKCPVLRKDFILDEYQITEARSIGADVVLLIARMLSPEQVASFSKFAKSLGMEVLLEISDKEELRHLTDYVDLVGINNRNLEDFSISLDRSFELGKMIPSDFVKISESGISDPETIVKLRNLGFKGFLIGDLFMKNSRPELTCARFIKELRILIENKQEEK